MVGEYLPMIKVNSNTVCFFVKLFQKIDGHKAILFRFLEFLSSESMFIMISPCIECLCGFKLNRDTYLT